MPFAGLPLPGMLLPRRARLPGVLLTAAPAPWHAAYGIVCAAIDSRTNQQARAGGVAPWRARADPCRWAEGAASARRCRCINQELACMGLRCV